MKSMAAAMIQRQQFINIKIQAVVLLIATLQLLGCTSQSERELKAGKQAATDGHYRIAINHFDKVLIRDPSGDLAIEAAREAARVSFFDIKDFRKAAIFYKHLVLYSKDYKERLQSQKQIADIYFDQLNDYPKAVVELNRLVAMLEDPKEKAFYKMSLARAYYYQNDFAQAENEADEFLRREIPVEQKFEMKMLKGNISLAKKDLPKAVEIFKNLLKEYPEQSRRDNVALTLSVCYEEMKDYTSAMEVLEQLKEHHPMPEYIDLRIKRLQARLKNLPGARGKYRK